MQILLANAKIMFDKSEVQPLTEPKFQSIANQLAMEMASCDIETLAKELDGSLKMQAVWAKSCRGAMVRYILTNKISDPEDLKAFSYEGFEYIPTIDKVPFTTETLAEDLFPHFVREI